MTDTLVRAARAKALLEDPLLTEAFDVLECTQVSIFTDHLCSAEQLMEAHRMVRALRAVKEHLQSVIVDGKMLQAREGRKGQHRG